MKKILGIITAFLLSFSFQSLAQSSPNGGVYIILDASGSMWGRLEGEVLKIVSAKEALVEYLQGDFTGNDIALRVYGHRREKDCSDSELLIPFSSPEAVASQVKSILGEIKPKGRTPISLSLRAALEDFGDRAGKIILISDGIETCNEDPCELVRLWKEKNVAIQVHVVGLGLNEKERAAMECIADAADTEYQDVSTVDELRDKLDQVKEVESHTSLTLIGKDSTGREQRIFGTLSQKGQPTYEVGSNGRNPVLSGSYELSAGIRTANGNLYMPISQAINILPDRDNVIQVEVVLPPQVFAVFVENGTPVKGSLIRAYQNGKEVFSQRPIDTLFVDPGTYEFRASPNSDNQLQVSQTVAPLGKTQVTFAMAYTVHVNIQMKPKGKEESFPLNIELWREGKRIYKVHRSNGKKVIPGVYDVVLPHALTPYTVTGLKISDEDPQNILLDVPCGFVSFLYQKADGSPDSPDRVFVSTADKNQGEYHNGEQVYPLLPGKYKVKGWRYKGSGKYPEVAFEVKEGERLEVVIRAEE